MQPYLQHGIDSEKFQTVINSSKNFVKNKDKRRFIYNTKLFESSAENKLCKISQIALNRSISILIEEFYLTKLKKTIIYHLDAFCYNII
ncbi:hypothetical protein BpHYR1_004461 [Brachionus plicatilis]|uniref:Uncharacterized protein n=1 Tax=Brachionus plicatilis TaxID=10195 RepID=A0A3M7S9G1_BRAPC|nr:hypothetical protein BpHYR1_004461 [Brachionus plicatilis]